MLTHEEIKVLFALDKLAKLKGYPPSLREIGAEIDACHMWTQRRLRKLEKAGYIRLTPNTYRSAVVLKLPETMQAA